MRDCLRRCRIRSISDFGVATQGLIESLEINPLVVLEHGAFGVDVLVRRSEPARAQELLQLGIGGASGAEGGAAGPG